MWIRNGGKARRKCWTVVTEYTQSTPPLKFDRYWRIWMSETQIIQGWGGQIGARLETNDPIRDGTYYQATNEDRTANDWELIDGSRKPS